jgi:antitoxin PrlF
MATAVSKLTRKYQATIPAPVRRALGLQAGDAIAFDLRAGAVRLRKARPLDVEFSRALEHTLGEWNGKADEEAYRGLWGLWRGDRAFSLYGPPGQQAPSGTGALLREGIQHARGSLGAGDDHQPRQLAPLDCAIADLDAAGLPAPSVVRMKLFTLHNRLILRKAGRLARTDEQRVRAGLSRLLAARAAAP